MTATVLLTTALPAAAVSTAGGGATRGSTPDPRTAVPRAATVHPAAATRFVTPPGTWRVMPAEPPVLPRTDLVPPSTSRGA